MTTATPNPDNALEVGTRVLNTEDGEPGTIHAATGWNTKTGEWTEYEVLTNDGIEVWKRDAFVLFSELDAAMADAE